MPKGKISYENLLQNNKSIHVFRNSNAPGLSIEISRSLSILGKHLKLLPVENVQHIFSLGLSYVLSNIEHFIESVRNYVQTFFNELVLTAAKHKNSGERQ